MEATAMQLRVLQYTDSTSCGCDAGKLTQKLPFVVSATGSCSVFWETVCKLKPSKHPSCVADHRGAAVPLNRVSRQCTQGVLGNRCDFQQSCTPNHVRTSWRVQRHIACCVFLWLGKSWGDQDVGAQGCGCTVNHAQSTVLADTPRTLHAPHHTHITHHHHSV